MASHCQTLDRAKIVQLFARNAEPLPTLFNSIEHRAEFL